MGRKNERKCCKIGDLLGLIIYKKIVKRYNEVYKITKDMILSSGKRKRLKRYSLKTSMLLLRKDNSYF